MTWPTGLDVLSAKCNTLGLDPEKMSKYTTLRLWRSPYLTVGTDVKCQIPRAFCEAKIKTAKRLVKAKVTFKPDLSTAEVHDENIKGPLKVGAVVEVKNQDGVYQEATINKLTDASIYTVVFVDGDEKTLRRSSLCLKGARHFAESETLDRLPLTNPEHFVTPVIGKKGNRDADDRTQCEYRPPPSTRILRGSSQTLIYQSQGLCLSIRMTVRQQRTSRLVSTLILTSELVSGADRVFHCATQEEELSSSSSEEEESDQRQNEDLFGKVVCVEGVATGDKKKTTWYPALVISPDCHEDVTMKKDNIFVRSFKDGKLSSSQAPGGLRTSCYGALLPNCGWLPFCSDFLISVRGWYAVCSADSSCDQDRRRDEPGSSLLSTVVLMLKRTWATGEQTCRRGDETDHSVLYARRRCERCAVWRLRRQIGRAAADGSSEPVIEVSPLGVCTY
ncbi:AT-rich interactive domain-containing protein 4B isoform X1 [Lates japonicus]|uniref:AT-rich interactive domain-containing protein 4B isoform X1 n=1 Tax=Lates japonicus TaxID=270547 RepID=A0AAD3NFE8_LATJO|nr:AT-rich interactive domain-containing protein 4B isoform X1 [Lates japonicus]